jgi:hypothetical protein
MTNPSSEDFVFDLVRMLMEDALTAKRSSLEAEGADKVFIQGKMLAYNEVLSTVKNQLLAFGFNLADFGLDRFDPDRELT